jgi:MFS family permease
VLAVRLVPELPTHVRRFDLWGVVLSAVGMFLLVFGIQEGQSYHWGTIAGPISVWSLIIAGLVVLGVFIAWQARTKEEPLLSLSLFRDRNFSLAAIAIATVGFGVTAMAFPTMLYAQGVLGLSPTQAALLFVPMAVISGGLSPYVGRLTDRAHPRWVAGFGLACFVGGLVWLAAVMGATTPFWVLLGPIALIGVANGYMWAPISTSATRNLPMSQAGAASGVYNTTRQIGAVLGSAGIAVLMQARITAELPGGGEVDEAAARLPPALHAGFSAAMAQSLLLPAAVLAAGLVAALCFARPRHLAPRRPDVEPARN